MAASSKSERNHDFESDEILLKECTQKIEAMERLMDTSDRRSLTPIALNKLAYDLRNVILIIREIRTKPIRGRIRSIDSILANLRRAQDELYIAIEISESKNKFTENKSRSFYKCLSSFQDFLFEALQNF